MRALLLDGPAWLWRMYWLLIAALSILCLVTAALTMILWLLGVPVPLPPPVAPPVPTHRARVTD
jgi:hypothetical protein